MTYEEWEQGAHDRVKAEPVWGFAGYRKALFLYDLAWQDCEKLGKDTRGRAASGQLIRSCGSVRANMRKAMGVDTENSATGSLPLPLAPPVKPRVGTGAPGTCSLQRW
jgi:hypothetical protein